MSARTPMPTASPEYVRDARFTKTFELPPNPDTGRDCSFKVTYADYGYRNANHPEEENVLLFFGPLLCSRLLHIAKDRLAKKHKVRIINPDRPGIGGTKPVQVSRDRLSFWREVNLALLKHLGIQHVSVAAHSGGTIYAVDLLLHNPEILHPERPYLAIGGPWILPRHTGCIGLSVAQALPAGLIGTVDRLASLIHNHVGPALGTSFGLGARAISRLMPSSSSSSSAGKNTTTTTTAEEENDGSRTGNDESFDDAMFEDDVWPHILSRVYEEGVKGMSTDAILLMQKGVKDGEGWSDWGDYDTGISRLVEAAAAVRRNNSGNIQPKKLRVDVLYAESDYMIGDGKDAKGPKWFDGCWKAGVEAGTVEYRSQVVKGADHDGVWTLEWGAAQEVLETVGKLRDGAPSESPMGG